MGKRTSGRKQDRGRAPESFKAAEDYKREYMKDYVKKHRVYQIERCKAYAKAKKLGGEALEAYRLKYPKYRKDKEILVDLGELDNWVLCRRSL